MELDSILGATANRAEAAALLDSIQPLSGDRAEIGYGRNGKVGLRGPLTGAIDFPHTHPTRVLARRESFFSLTKPRPYWPIS